VYPVIPVPHKFLPVAFVTTGAAAGAPGQFGIVKELQADGDSNSVEYWAVAVMVAPAVSAGETVADQV
jgi:hypothetical protein